MINEATFLRIKMEISNAIDLQEDIGELDMDIGKKIINSLKAYPTFLKKMEQDKLLLQNCCLILSGYVDSVIELGLYNEEKDFLLSVLNIDINLIKLPSLTQKILNQVILQINSLSVSFVRLGDIPDSLLDLVVSTLKRATIISYPYPYCVLCNTLASICIKKRKIDIAIEFTDSSIARGDSWIIEHETIEDRSILFKKVIKATCVSLINRAVLIRIQVPQISSPLEYEENIRWRTDSILKAKEFYRTYIPEDETIQMIIKREDEKELPPPGKGKGKFKIMKKRQASPSHKSRHSSSNYRVRTAKSRNQSPKIKLKENFSPKSVKKSVDSSRNNSNYRALFEKKQNSLKQSFNNNIQELIELNKALESELTKLKSETAPIEIIPNFEEEEKDILEKIIYVSNLQENIKTEKQSILDRIEKLEKKLQKEQIFASKLNSGSNNITSSEKNSTPNNRKLQKPVTEFNSIHRLPDFSVSENKSQLGPPQDIDGFSSNRSSRSMQSHISGFSKISSAHTDYFRSNYIVYLKNALLKYKRTGFGSSESFYRLFQFNSLYYHMLFTIQNKSEGINIEIKISSFSSETLEKNELLWTEDLDEEQIVYLLLNITPKDVLPVSLPLPSFSKLSFFISFILVHFIAIVRNEQEAVSTSQNNLVSIKSDVSGLLPERQIKFRGSLFYITFIHISNYDFRLILRPEIEDLESRDEEDFTEKSIKIEVYFDELSLKKLFRIFEDSNQCAAALEELLNGGNTKECIKKMEEFNTFGRVNILLRPEKQGDIEELIDKFLVYFEDYLDFMERTVDQAYSFERIFMIKPIDMKKDQYVVCECYDSTSVEAFVLVCRNTFESYSTSHPGEKTKELAKFYTKLSEIRTSLGLNYNGLDLIGKRFVWFIYMKRAKMIFYEKEPFGMLMDDKDRMDRQKRDKVKQNRNFRTLKLIHLEVSLTFRFFVGNYYKIPITLEFVSFMGELLGMKITTYDPALLSKNGIFLVPFALYYQHNPDEKPKRRMVNLSQKDALNRFGILNLFKTQIFKTMKEKVIEFKDGVPILKMNKVSGGYTSVFNSLDSFYDLNRIYL